MTIKARTAVSVEKATVTPETISVNDLLKDLANGIGKKGMCDKYNVKKWELDEVFKHPALKGKRPAHVKKLSFTFVDDTGEQPIEVTPSDLISETLPHSINDVCDEPIIDPNQVTLEQAIDEAIESVGEIKTQMQETQDAIIDMLSPTETETPEETIAMVNGPIDEDDELEIPTLSDTMELVKEQEIEAETEEEVEVEEDEFDSFQL
tara:strand:- start:3716 stop:4336 length:621 start_codon:yes stop_codon:yes gene_type:complete